MATIDWPERRLCDDGGCTGIIGSEGTCKVCGRASQFWGDERRRGMEDDADGEGEGEGAGPGPGPGPGSDGDDDDRELCPDGSCTGVIGIDGKCKVCGKWGEGKVGSMNTVEGEADATAEEQGQRQGQGSDDERRLCPDGACTGLIGSDGRCKVCGKSEA